MHLPPDIYRGQLATLGNGYALYEPDPGREVHVEVGDVGFIDPSMGRFHRLFNVFFDEEDPINKRHGVPEHHVPLPDELKSTYARTSLPIGVLSSKRVSTLEVDFDLQGTMIPAGASIQLSSSNEQGAVLIIKEEAHRTDSNKIFKLGAALKKNYKLWYIHLCNIFGDVPLRQMVLVTGYDLTSDWATATFMDESSSAKVSFKVSDPQSASLSSSFWGKWESSTSAPVRCGPSLNQKGQHLPIEGDSGRNQCIFVRGWRISERPIKLLPPRLEAAAEPKDDEPRSDSDEDNMVMLLGIEGTPVNQHLSQEVYDEAFENLHNAHSTETVVLLHDDDVSHFLKAQDDNTYPSEVMVWKYDLLDFIDSDDRLRRFREHIMNRANLTDLNDDLPFDDSDLSSTRDTDYGFGMGTLSSTSSLALPEIDDVDEILVYSGVDDCYEYHSNSENYRMDLNNKLQAMFHSPAQGSCQWEYRRTGPENIGKWFASVTIQGRTYGGSHEKLSEARELAARSALAMHNWNVIESVVIGQ